MKTSRSLYKRIKKTGSGKLLHLRVSAQHLARRKSRRTRQQALAKEPLTRGDRRLLRKFLPHL